MCNLVKLNHQTGLWEVKTRNCFYGQYANKYIALKVAKEVKNKLVSTSSSVDRNKLIITKKYIQSANKGVLKKLLSEMYNIKGAEFIKFYFLQPHKVYVRDRFNCSERGMFYLLDYSLSAFYAQYKDVICKWAATM